MDKTRAIGAPSGCLVAMARLLLGGMWQVGFARCEGARAPMTGTGCPRGVNSPMSIAGKVRTLLIVDDEERLRKAMERSFRQEGYQTWTAASGEEALTLLRGEKKVDLVITDLVMPGMDGMALVRAIRDFDPGMKVIILTAYGSDESMTEAEALGVAYYLSKPFDLFHLKSRVERLLKAHAAGELTYGGQASRAFCLICSTVGKAVGAVVELPRKALPYVQPERLVFTAGKAAGAVSGLCLGIWRRSGEAR